MCLREMRTSFEPLSSGGIDGPYFKALEAANGGRMELLRGQVPGGR